MEPIRSLDELESHYGAPGAAALRKVAPRLTPEYRAWIERSRFCILSTVGPEGTDASPRGDEGQVVRVLDETALALPDWHGNNRIDTLRNIVRDPRVSLLFLVPGSDNVVRVNGRGLVTADPDLRQSFARGGRLPRTVTVVTPGEVYFQCARAILRSGLWAGRDDSAGLPTAGDFLAAMTEGAEGGAGYDAGWARRAAGTLW
ncbi:pyridoxamine 5'-phosphate oxidase family protein [Oceaniglobus roseus]|uniref:pyridoxamine 5'-phosphate oxidase family protein n=1 Tax=Oceaniglobus roseus TaxID=1737570 RepID=UPI000C7F69B1|nr:pyridoxamine 5'-phosphate oxidase family protein [Kandeliimicrobium roseum]